MAAICRLLLIAAAGLVTFGGGILVHIYTLPALAGLCYLLWPRGRVWSGWSHGTARIAGYADLVRRKLLGPEGLLIGRASFVDPPGRRHALWCLLSPFVGSAQAVRLMLAAFWRGYDDSIVRIRDYVHAITFAPTGAGKGVCIQIPNLLTYLGSMVVVDPQGTLFKVTAWFRQHVLGHKIIKMDPTGFTGPAAESDCLNPCDFLDENSDNFIDDIRSFVTLMVQRDPQEHQPFFNDWAIIVLSSMLAFICSCESDASKRSLALMRDLVSSRKAFTDAKEAMLAVPGLVAKLGGMLDIPVDRELAAILATVQRHTAWMDSPPIAANLSKSTWDPRWLWSGKVTVYLILPSNKLSTLAPLMRLWIGVILNVVTRKGASEKRPILFMIDEAAHIGKIQILEDAMTLMRAYGIRIWLFFQSMNQLQKCYGENAQTIIENASIRQFFGTVAFDSADYISRNVGDCTILVESINRNRNRSTPTGSAREPQPGSVSTGDGVTISEAARRLLKPEEILLLPEDVSLTFYKNMPVIATQLVPYFADPAFKGRRVGRSPGIGLAGGLFSVAAFVLAALTFLLALHLPVPVMTRRADFEPTPYRYNAMPPPPLPRPSAYPASPVRRPPAASRPVRRRGQPRYSPVNRPYFPPGPMPGRFNGFN